MKICKNVLKIIYSIALISFGLGIFLGKFLGFYICVIAVLLITIGIFLALS